MAQWNRNEPTAANRRVGVFVFESDGTTPAPLATNFTGVKATMTPSGVTGALVSVVFQWHVVGSAFNSKRLAFVADGSGAGNTTVSGNDITFHYATGVTTVNNAITALGALSIDFTGTFTGTATLTAGDAFALQSFTGGADSNLFVRQGGTTWATAAGSWTNTGIDGHWVYEATQGETDFTGTEFELRVTKATFQQKLEKVNMIRGDFGAIGEGSHTYGDLVRLLVGVMFCTVQDFRSGVLTFKSLDGSKTRGTVNTDASGRVTSSVGDLTP